MNVMRKGAKTKELAIELGIAQIEEAKLVGFVVSAQDAKLRHDAACEAMALKEIESRAMMDRLRNNIKRKPLTADEMSELYYPKRRKY